MTKEKIIIQIGDEIIELKGKELETFIEDRVKSQKEFDAQKEQKNTQLELKISAYTKLGLTEEEINAIL